MEAFDCPYVDVIPGRWGNEYTESYRCARNQKECVMCACTCLNLVKLEMKGWKNNMDLKIFTNNIEQGAVDQINLLMQQEAFKDCKVRIMPDVHAGTGCVIGFTADLGTKVIPNIVGVDIGCGVRVVELGNIQIDFDKLDSVIRECVPNGRNVHESRMVPFPKLQELHCYRELRDTKRLERSIGTLGGGNHFIEIDSDEEGNRYLIIHTGSRNLGKQVAEYYQNIAHDVINGNYDKIEKREALIKEYKESGRRSEIQAALAELDKQYYRIERMPKDLCYLEGENRKKYLDDMFICQSFAYANREHIAKIILSRMDWTMIDEFESVHNYIEPVANMVRKGAISAKDGERVIIPMNMRDGCILGRGKGNKDWNYSAPHGAGRIMSRMKAKETLDIIDYRLSMQMIYTTSVCEDTLDEAPMVYKPIDEIVKNIGDTVTIDKIIKPIYNFKAAE